MKAKKTKDLNKKVKKQIKSDLEINLKSKLTDFVKSLGHDANDIGAELKKMSRLLAKKLSRKVKSVKSITELKTDKKAALSKTKLVKKEAVKSPEKVKKVIAKVVKKSGDKAARIEDIVKKEIINPAKVVLDAKDDASEVKPIGTAKSSPVTKSKTKPAAAKPVAAKSTATKSGVAKTEGTTKIVATKPPAAKSKDSQNKSNIRKPGAVKKGDDKS